MFTVALLKRWPRLWYTPRETPLIDVADIGTYTTLAGDLATVNEVIGPRFKEYDLNALRAQNSYWRQQVSLLCVSALTTGFGSVQAAYSHQVWPGVVVAVLGVLTAAVAGLGGERGAQLAWLDQRTKAERLRSMAFAYLAELPPFTGHERDRQLKLVNAVADVTQGQEPQ
jgi:SMODS and SLOG-associating 2TM effector domain 3